MASPWPVAVCETLDSEEIFRLELPDGLYYEAAPARMWLELKNGMIKAVSEAATRVHAQGLRFGPAAWTGIQSDYPLIDRAGLVVGTGKIRYVAEVPTHASRPGPVMQGGRARLARQAARQGYTLLNAEWHGPQWPYEFVDSAGNSVRMTVAQLQKAEQAQLHEMAQMGSDVDPGYTLISEKWYGSASKYAWRTSDGNHHHESLSNLRRKSCRISIRLLEEEPVTSTLVGAPRFRWTLPDSYCVDATWQEFDAALKKVLGSQSASRPPKQMSTGFSAAVRAEVIARVASHMLDAPPDGLPVDSATATQAGQLTVALSAITLAVRHAIHHRDALKPANSSLLVRRPVLTLRHGSKAGRAAGFRGRGRSSGFASQGR